MTMRHPREAQSPVVVFANGYGDHLMALPTLRALAGQFPGRLRIVCMSWAQQFFFPLVPIRDAIHLDGVTSSTTPDGALLLGHDFEVAPLIERIGDCDLLVVLHPWLSLSLHQLIAGVAAPLSIGFGGRYPIDLEHRGGHATDRMFGAARAINGALRIEAFATAPIFTREQTREAEAIMSDVPRGMRVLTVHADTLDYKLWSSDRFTTVVRRFLEDHDDFLALLVGGCDLLWELSAFHERVVPCFGLDLPTSMEIVGRSHLFLGIDSCMLHAADLFGTPGVGIFGPTDPAEFGFRFAPHRHVRGTGTSFAQAPDVLDALEELLGGIDVKERVS